MEYRDILSRRRMHRAFLPDPLPREQIDRIAAPIRHAPSAGFGFSQGGSIVVVTRDETREAIALLSATSTAGSRLRSRRRRLDGLVHRERW
jgi:nitroreductase